MKRFIAILLCFVVILSCLGVVAFAANEDIALCNNNVMVTETSFYISSSGKAEIGVCYNGYPGITTGAKITTILEKSINGDWSEINRWVENTSTDTFLDVYEPQLTRGTYRITVEYVISGLGGPDDIITEEMTKTY